MKTAGISPGSTLQHRFVKGCRVQSVIKEVEEDGRDGTSVTNQTRMDSDIGVVCRRLVEHRVVLRGNPGPPSSLPPSRFCNSDR